MTNFSFIISLVLIGLLAGCVQTPRHATAAIGPILGARQVVPAAQTAGTAAIQENSTATNQAARQAEQCLPESGLENLWLASLEIADPFLPAMTAYTNIWERIRAGYAIAQVDNKRVQRKLNWYIKHPRHLQRVAERARRYIHHVVEAVDQAGLPMELALLPIVESGYDPFAYSHGRASGIWQFIASTGRHYGLQKNWWYDGRRDISASTEAALSYLRHLYQELNQDWLLALAAYNTGEGNVRRAVARNRKAGKPTDFWNLRLPRETSAYVPKLLAVARLIKQPELFNIELTDIPDAPYFESVDVGTQIDLANAARLAGIEEEELYLLNPGFNRWATAPQGPHALLIPVENLETFRRAFAQLTPQQRLPWQRYKIRRGDSLGRIASRYGTSVTTLRKANNLHTDVIQANAILLVPATRYSVTSIAHTHQQDLETIFKLSRNASRIDYRVKPGDSLWRIARQFRVSIRELASWNSMTPAEPLQAGRHITIWIKKSRSEKAGRVNMVRKVGYRVRSGDSLYEIAQRFSIKSDDIARWNALSKDDYLQPGQALTLYIDLRNAI